MSLSNRFIFVAAAAVAATMGDLLMLYVVADAQASPGVVRPPGARLVLGAMLGVLGIPFYWYGYWLLAQAVAVTGPGMARVIVVCGALIGLIGGFIHAVTAFAIRFDMIAGNVPAAPMDWVASWGTPLIVCWVLVAGAAVVASLGLLASAFSAPPPISRLLCFLNPVVITLVVGAGGIGSPIGEAFVVPAAPNVAHVLFFFLAASLAHTFANERAA